MALKMIQIVQRLKKNVAAAFVLVVLSILISGNCSAGEFVKIVLFPEHVGVFTTVMKQQFVAFGVDANGVSTNITEQVDWESSDQGIVTIDESGMATVVPGKTAGQVKISCSYPKTRKLQPGVNILLLKPAKER
jgi:hypothetical protein